MTENFPTSDARKGIFAVTIQREPSQNGATIGRMTIGGEFECWTLEDAVREVPGKLVKDWKIAGITAIPTGHYPLVIDFSNRFQRMMPHILNVPGFEGVRIHWGNSAKDTEGCPIVGKDRGKAAIWNSHAAFDQFYEKLKAHLDAGGGAWIDVLNPSEVMA